MAKGGRLRYASAADMPESMRRLLPPAAMKTSEAPIASSRPRHTTHVPGRMNKTEAAYAQQLTFRKHAGEVLWFGFETVKLRLATRTWLTVDFLVRLADGTFELHEVKGRKGTRYYATEDGKIKAKVAAEQYPFWPFRIVWPRAGGGWASEMLCGGVL